MISSKLLPVVLLVTTALASIGPSALAHPPQSHSVRKFTLAKRQNGSGIGVGSSCSIITGNPDDIICEISGENVSCAPVCCTRNGEFVDGCPAGDQCVFEAGTLKCCPVGKNCGPRPTACLNFGVASTRNGQAVCPSATPTCTTREDGGIACTGTGVAGSSTDEATPTGRRIARPNAPNPTAVGTTAEANMSTVTSSAGNMEETGTRSMEEETTALASFSLSPSGTRTLPDTATPTDENRPAGTSSGSSANSVMDGNLIFGLVVAGIVAFGLLL
ncbi:hypothetical protein TWF281_004771 [Arthrobotrys megalospora]